jgi:hypothetical protein
MRDKERCFGVVSYSWIGRQLRREGLVLRKRRGCRSACGFAFKPHLRPLFYQPSSAIDSLRVIQSVINCLTLLLDAGASVTLNMKGAVKKVKPVCFVWRCIRRSDASLCCYRCWIFARGLISSGQGHSTSLNNPNVIPKP